MHAHDHPRERVTRQLWAGLGPQPCTEGSGLPSRPGDCQLLTTSPKRRLPGQVTAVL